MHKELTPPIILYHGTVEKYKHFIKIDGLIPMGRDYVHLTSDIMVANTAASSRKTANVILKIAARDMHNDGYKFYKSTTNVWLVERVPPKYIKDNNG